MQDREGLMKLLTAKSVEETVKKRVEKKAKVFGQEVTVEGDGDQDKGNYKIDPSFVSRLYDKWIIPLTKLVEVEYLLKRLDWIHFTFQNVFNFSTISIVLISLIILKQN